MMPADYGFLAKQDLSQQPLCYRLAHAAMSNPCELLLCVCMARCVCVLITVNQKGQRAGPHSSEDKHALTRHPRHSQDLGV